MTQSIITAGDASAGLVTQAGNDGTLVLQVGPAGSKVDALTITAAGVVKQPPQSMVRLNTANGYGSTNTAIRRFTNTVTNQGADITYADSATLGASFTINTAGVYAIEWGDQFTGASFMAITLNDTAVGNAGSMLASSSSIAANFPGGVSWTGYLAAGSVVRAACGTASGTATAYCQFTITRVA